MKMVNFIGIKLNIIFKILEYIERKKYYWELIVILLFLFTVFLYLFYFKVVYIYKKIVEFFEFSFF